jgi:hypothetical protein
MLPCQPFAFSPPQERKARSGIYTCPNFRQARSPTLHRIHGELVTPFCESDGQNDMALEFALKRRRICVVLMRRRFNANSEEMNIAGGSNN